MELVAKLSYIEEVQDSVKKRYNALKAEVRENGSLTDVKKKDQQVLQQTCLSMLTNIITK